MDDALWQQAVRIDREAQSRGQSHVSYRELSDRLDIPIQRSRAIHFALQHRDIIAGSKPGRWKETKERDTWVIECQDTRICDVEDAIAKAGADMDIWELDRAIVNGWDVTMKLNTDDGDKPFRAQNQQIKVTLRRKVAVSVELAFEALLGRIDGHEPTYRHYPRITPTDPHMYEISMPDLHLGMYAWGRETGKDDYDTNIAARLYQRAVEELLNSVTGYDLERVLIPLGSDFLHMNDETAQTPRGKNRLDVDTRMAKVFEAATMAAVAVIDLCLTQADVQVIWVPGNHDPNTSWFIAKYLEAWYRRCDQVQIDVEPTTRKCVSYGRSLIGLTHGDEEHPRDLPGIMADTWKAEWFATDYHEWHCGHLHKKKEVFVVTGDTYAGGVAVRHLPSLSAIDAWHARRGYGHLRSAEGYLWSKTRGPRGCFRANVFDNEIAA